MRRRLSDVNRRRAGRSLGTGGIESLRPSTRALRARLRMKSFLFPFSNFFILSRDAKHRESKDALRFCNARPLSGAIAKHDQVLGGSSRDDSRFDAYTGRRLRSLVLRRFRRVGTFASHVARSSTTWWTWGASGSAWVQSGPPGIQAVVMPSAWAGTRL